MDRRKSFGNCRGRVAQLFIAIAMFASGLPAGSAGAAPTALPGSTTDEAAAKANAAGILRPTSLRAVPAAGAAVLNTPNYAELLKSVTVVRRHSLAEIQANPRALRLGAAKVNLAPILQRPGALPLVATRLRAAPDLGRVNAHDLEVAEVVDHRGVADGKRRTGLLIHSFLNYQLNRGACTNARERVEALGIRCAKRLTEADREAAYGMPADPRYIADARARAAAIDASRRNMQRVNAAIAKHIADLREMLNSPSAALKNGIGAQEHQRLQRLSDEELAREMIDSAQTKVEQILFVPLVPTYSPIDGSMLASMMNSQTPKVTPPTPTPTPVPVHTNVDIPPAYFLTGFTLGRDHEWSQQLETTISWCIFGCKETYYARVWAGFGYGLGLRFPMRLAGHYRYNRVGGGESASYSGHIEPIDANADLYTSLGLDASQAFGGKEIVAEFKAGAGLEAHLPLAGDYSMQEGYKGDLTDHLPAPFTGGHFVPPAAGSTANADVVFKQVDLLGGLADYGVIGARVYPAVQVGFHGDNLSFELHDDVANHTIPLKSDDTTTVGVKNHTSSFSVRNPVYGLSFSVAPGIDPTLFLDLDVWSDSWGFPIYFPELTVTLPPDGLTFKCHLGTVCTYSYQFGTVNGQTGTGAAAVQSANVDAALAAADAWGASFGSTWSPQCQDGGCSFGVKLLQLGTVLAVKETISATDYNNAIQVAASTSKISQQENDSVLQAKALVIDSNAKNTGKVEESFAVLTKSAWLMKCQDKDCVPEVTSIASQLAPEARKIQAQHPSWSFPNVSGALAKEFTPRFQGAIDHSTARAAVDAWTAIDDAFWKPKCTDNACRTAITLLEGLKRISGRQLLKANPGMSSLALSGTVGKQFAPLYQKEVDASQARAATAARNRALGDRSAPGTMRPVARPTVTPH